MRYKCKVCGFETDIKSQIHIHHIIPKEVRSGRTGKWNKVMLCARCHSLVYSPLAKKGIHTCKGMNSFEIISCRESTAGLLLECKNLQTNEIYYL
jgi:hypothetical protein